MKPLLAGILAIAISTALSSCASTETAGAHSVFVVRYVDSANPERKTSFERQIAALLTSSASIQAIADDGAKPDEDSARGKVSVTPANRDGIYKVEVTEPGEKKVALIAWVKGGPRDYRLDSGIDAKLIADELGKHGLSNLSAEAVERNQFSKAPYW